MPGFKTERGCGSKVRTTRLQQPLPVRLLDRCTHNRLMAAMHAVEIAKREHTALSVPLRVMRFFIGVVERECFHHFIRFVRMSNMCGRLRFVYDRR